jgi:hypothetical protein
MKRWRFLLSAMALLATTASASVCTLSTATSCTQVVNIPTGTVAGNGFYSASATFNLFGSIGVPAGSTLDSVTIEIVIRESVTALSLKNVGTNTMSNVTFTDAAYFDAGDTASASDDSLLDGALPNSLNLHRTPSNIINLHVGSLSPGIYTCGSGSPCQLPQTLTIDTGALSGTASSYTGSGQFNLTYTVNTSATLSGSDPIHLRLNSETRTTDATATVVYDFTSVPEPASEALFGGGLAAFVLGRRLLQARTASKSSQLTVPGQRSRNPARSVSRFWAAPFCFSLECSGEGMDKWSN